MIKKLYILGTGTANVSKYVNTSCILDNGNELFLTDGTGGTDILHSFDQLNLDWRNLYHACQYSHQTAKEAAEIAERNHVKNLILWHTEDGTYGKRRELYSREAAEYYQGKIWIPDDGDIIEL